MSRPGSFIRKQSLNNLVKPFRESDDSADLTHSTPVSACWTLIVNNFFSVRFSRFYFSLNSHSVVCTQLLNSRKAAASRSIRKALISVWCAEAIKEKETWVKSLMDSRKFANHACNECQNLRLDNSILMSASNRMCQCYQCLEWTSVCGYEETKFERCFVTDRAFNYYDKPEPHKNVL